MPTPVDEDESSIPVTPESSSMLAEAMESNGAEDNGGADSTEKDGSRKNRHRPRKQKLYTAIRKQMEFYFSDANITKQRMMKEIVLGSDYVNLQLFLEKFNKVSQLSKNIEDFRRALKHSDKLELSEDGMGVRRKVPYDEAKVKSGEDVEACTIYVENIPQDANHDWVEKIFQEFGQVAYVSLPKFARNSQPKGFAFVEFEDVEAAERCLKAYGELGACLSSNIDPSGLMSVTSYNEEMKSNKPKKGKSPRNTRKRAHGHSESSQNDEGIKEAESPRKKIKTEKTGDVDVDVGKGEADSDVKAEAVKCEDGATETVKQTGTGKAKKQINSSEKGSAKVKLEKIDMEPEVGTCEDSVGESGPDTAAPKTAAEAKVAASGKSKKRRRNKAKAKVADVTEEKLESDLIHLRILPKKHWRQLRNRYLNLQRENMSKLKSKLKTEENRRFLDPPVPVTNKSICVKINLSSPAESVEIFKSQIMNELVPLDWSNLVKYVDYEEGKLEAIVRLDGSVPGRVGVHGFVQNAGRVFKHVEMMTTEETDAYWLALRRTLKENQKQKIRGKDRILNQAMKVGSSHIHFEDADSD